MIILVGVACEISKIIWYWLLWYFSDSDWNCSGKSINGSFRLSRSKVRFSSFAAKELKMSKILNYLTPLLLWYRNPPDRFYHACVESTKSTKFEQYLDFLHLCLTWSQVFLGHCFSWKECVYWKINITREPKSGGSCYCLRRMSKTKTSEIY